MLLAFDGIDNTSIALLKQALLVFYFVVTLLFLDICLFFQVIYFQKLFILRGKSH
ncbi:hypothetical protein PROVRETT_05983 [Providencia rettgeri DSM 1131]|nr:hypothetical protein PROVRETT_05983 [Providencia rettgeri DSM 1131]